MLSLTLATEVSDSLQPHGLWPTRILCPWDFSSKNTGVGCHFILQEIFLTQGSNLCLLCLLHWQADSLSLSHPGCLKDMLSILKCTSQYSLTPPPTLPQRHTQSSKKMEIMPRFRSRALGEPGPHRSGTCMYFILSVF